MKWSGVYEGRRCWYRSRVLNRVLLCRWCWCDGTNPSRSWPPATPTAGSSSGSSMRAAGQWSWSTTGELRWDRAKAPSVFLRRGAVFNLLYLRRWATSPGLTTACRRWSRTATASCWWARWAVSATGPRRSTWRVRSPVGSGPPMTSRWPTLLMLGSLKWLD